MSMRALSRYLPRLFVLWPHAVLIRLQQDSGRKSPAMWSILFSRTPGVRSLLWE